jgi:nitroimidazol reductase NimA-like FMN-containing flavoprotein (pyridoxamine 5'-phosphate oxidase superfamily)
MIGTMSPDEIESTLRRQRVGRLACSANDRPYVVPISYAYDGDCVYACSTLGRKVSVMREQPIVCFEVDEIEGPSTWRCVIAEGAYEELTGDAARRDALVRLGGHNGDVVPRGLSAGDRIVVFRLRLTEKSGRFERQDA